MNELVRRYASAASGDRRRLFERLHARIVGRYPDAEIVVSYGILTYRAKSGWAAIGYWKDGVTVYSDGPSHLAAFKAKHPAIRTGKGSLSLKASGPIPMASIEQVVRHAIEHPETPRRQAARSAATRRR